MNEKNGKVRSNFVKQNLISMSRNQISIAKWYKLQNITSDNTGYIFRKRISGLRLNPWGFAHKGAVVFDLGSTNNGRALDFEFFFRSTGSLLFYCSWLFDGKMERLLFRVNSPAVRGVELGCRGF